jgi:hypothetical protein
MPPKIGNAPSIYAAELNPSSPGGNSPGAKVFSNPCDPAASQSWVQRYKWNLWKATNFGNRISHFVFKG